jgi:cytochrome c-type biogenesis protein
MPFEFLNFIQSFILGLLTPLTAVCVLPLYPGFLSYLSTQLSQQKNIRQQKYFLPLFGVIISIGVILFMFILGLLATTLFQISLAKVIGIVSPIAFLILAFISLLLILNVDLSRYMPQIHTPVTKKPLLSAFIFGFFFGAIVIPCNPAFIAAFLTRTALITNPITSIAHFLLFGLGLAFPLLLFSLISTTASASIIYFATKNQRWINRIAGIIMLAISLYYLIFVFHIFG